MRKAAKGLGFGVSPRLRTIKFFRAEAQRTRRSQNLGLSLDDDEGGRRRLRHRHAELVSASIVPDNSLLYLEKLTLKQVLGDDG
jgi:hypothetical protein